MNAEESVRNARVFMDYLDEKMDGLNLPVGLNSRISGALLHLSLEHFGAIVVLISNNLNGSAAALIRLQYEALIRGYYFHHCASEDEAMKFSEGKEPPKIGEMIKCLESKSEFTSGVLSKVHNREWKVLNSFTHGGSSQVDRRFSGSELIGSYSDEDRFGIVTASNYMARMAAMHVALVCGNVDLVKQIQSEHKNMNKL